MKHALLLCATVFIGCSAPGASTAPPPAQRYVFYPGPQTGLIDSGFLLDTATGRMWKLNGSTFETLLGVPIPEWSK